MIIIVVITIVNSPFQTGDFSTGSITDMVIIEEKDLVKTFMIIFEKHCGNT